MADMEQLRLAVSAKAEAMAVAARRDAELRELIRGAIAAGVPVKDLVAVTGLSKPRMYQIRDNRR